MRMSEKPQYVTLIELDRKLDKGPTRWEVRFLILVGFIGANFIPVDEAAQAAIHLFK